VLSSVLVFDGIFVVLVVCIVYIFYLLGVVYWGDYVELVVVVLLCFWVYVDVGEWLFVVISG